MFGNAIFVKGLKAFSRRVAVTLDAMTIDGLVNGVAKSFFRSSKQISLIQTGHVRSYVVYFGLFMLVLIFVYLFSHGNITSENVNPMICLRHSPLTLNLAFNKTF